MAKMTEIQKLLAKARAARDPRKVAAAARKNGELGGRPAGSKNKKRIIEHSH